MKTHAYDVIIIGGAFSGASMGMLLRRTRPNARVLIVERSVEFDRKVGESTSEVAAAFMTRVLRISKHLNREHIVKQGLRLWFNESAETPFDRCSEIGALYQSRLSTYQIDRSKLDSHLLEQAEAGGCEVWRPAKVNAMHLEEGGLQELQVEVDGEKRTVTARWVVDASGKAAMLARKLGHWRRLEGHPTNSMWAPYSGVGDLDGEDLAERFPDYAKAVRTSRDTATNHLMGRGWWCWIIPLKNGDTSLGLTYDRRLFAPPAEGTIAERLLEHVRAHPVGRELFAQAVPTGTDMKAYAHLPYRTDQICGDGWVCVGDAAGFMDPLYSQGLDYCSHTVSAGLQLIQQGLDGQVNMGLKVEALNQLFLESYDRWFASLYQDKYYYLGDAELMNAAFLMDLASYFIGPVRLVYDMPEKEWPLLPYAGVAGGVFARFMSLYNRRLAHIAKKRWQAGVYGRRNVDQRYLVKSGFVPSMGLMFKLLRQGVGIWLRAEWNALFLPAVEGETAEWPAEPMPAEIKKAVL